MVSVLELFLRAMKYSPSPRVRTLYCMLAYTWLPRLVIALALLVGLLVALFYVTA